MQTFTGREYLKIDIASNYGLEKTNWNDRITWFDNNEHQLEKLVPQAEHPALFFAGVQAYRDVQAGKPIGYMISLDATSSGLQILAALTGDRSAAQLCNVVNTGNREDAYTLIHAAMVAQTGLGSGITREMAKEAIMTSLYGSTAVPKRVFGEGSNLRAFYHTMETLAPAAWELNQAMLGLWDPTAWSFDWILPDNFHVHTPVMTTVTEYVNVMGDPFEVSYKINAPIEGGRALGANIVHSIDGMMVRELTRRCSYDPKVIERVKTALAGYSPSHNRAVTDDDKIVLTLWNHYTYSGYLSARILDHLHPENIGHIQPSVIQEILDTLPEKPFTVVSVHDCFRCLPHYGNDLRQQYNLQLALIARSNLLQAIVSQILGKNIQVNPLDPSLPADILAADYALS